MSVIVFDAPREDDELRLCLLRRALKGEDMTAIGKSMGKGGSFGRVTVARIREADLAQSGEDPAIVSAYYPEAK